MFPASRQFCRSCPCCGLLHLAFTASRISQVTGDKGKLWQQEPLDHLVRRVAQYEYLKKSIADNSIKARLKPGEYLYRRFDE